MNTLERKSISFVRVFATILILCCHIMPLFNSAILKMSAQFFNVGVYIFLILSGFLYGKRKISDSLTYKKWLIKRGKRILIPMYIFLMILLSIYLIKGMSINFFNWMIYILNLQAIEAYLNGAEHLWYLTIAMFCYFTTVPLDMYREKFNNKNISFLLISISIIQLIVSYLVYKQLGIYILYLEVYIISYFIGMYWGYDKIDLRKFSIFTVILFTALLTRIIGRVFFDDTILYNVIIVGYTQSFIGFSLVYICFYIISRKGEKINFKIVNYLDSISYEIYLVHYMFIVGPISLMITDYKIVNCIMVLICTYITALVLNKMYNFILKIMSNKKYKVIKFLD